MPGIPDASAYAMPTGTSIVVMTRPATMSLRNHEDWYPRSVCNAGIQRVQPVDPSGGRYDQAQGRGMMAIRSCLDFDRFWPANGAGQVTINASTRPDVH